MTGSIPQFFLLKKFCKQESVARDKAELLKTSIYRLHDLRSSEGGEGKKGKKMKMKKDKNSHKFVN